MKKLLLILALLLGATPALAQTLAGTSLRLNTGPCIITSTGTGPKLILSGCQDITTAAATNMTLSPLDDLALNPAADLEMNPGGDVLVNPAGNDVLPSTGYDINLGMLTRKYLTLHAAELWVETLVAQNTIATIGGRIIVAPTNTLTRDLLSTDFTGSYPTQNTLNFCVKYNLFKLHVGGVEFGSKIIMQSNNKFEAFYVNDTSQPTVTGQGDYCYNVWRNQDNTGTNDWYAGDAAVDTGKLSGSGPDGFIDMYSLSGLNAGTAIGPTIVGNVRTTADWNGWAPRWAIGNLDGLYGYSGSTYGTAFGNPSATYITIDATNGFRIRNTSNTRFSADTSGNMFVFGDLNVSTSGQIRSGATDYTTGTGYFMDYNAGTPRFRIGVPGGAGLDWNGSSLVVRGTAGSSTNMLRNSDCAVSTEDWVRNNNHGVSETWSFGLDPWDLGNTGGTCYTQPLGTPANATATFHQYGPFPVVAGQRYEASAYLGVHGTSLNAFAYMYYTDSSAVLTNQAFGNDCVSSGKTGGYYLTNYCRSGVISTASANSVNGYIIVYRAYDGVQANPATFFTHAFFGEATSSQTELSAWGPAGITEITGGVIRTGTILANHLSVSTLSTISANIGTVTAGTITGVSITTNTGTIGGFTLGSTTLTGDNLIISNTGNITVGTSNNVARMSDDGTIRFWAGHATAGSAPFQVHQDGDVVMAGGDVEVNGSGITIAAGGGSTNQVKWTDGSAIYSSSDNIVIDSENTVELGATAGTQVMLENGLFSPSGISDVDLGNSSSPWDALTIDGPARINNLAGSGNDYVCVDADGDLFRSDTAC